jgi:hypothetical protein
MSILNVDTLDNGSVIVNIGDSFGYVMVELTDSGVQITVIDGDGDVRLEKELDLLNYIE